MFLYQDIVFRRVGQIPALVRTLRSNKEDVEDHIKSFTFACFVPEPWDDVVSRNIGFLIDRCPRLRSLAFWGPFVDWLQTSDSNGRVFDPVKTFRSHSNNITKLAYFDLLQSTAPILDIVPGSLLTSFPNLTHLSLTSHSSPSETYNPATPDPSLLNLSFPHLTHLDLLPKNGPIAMAFFYILHTWSLPSLTHLRMDLSLQWHNCTSYDHHIAFLNKFGPQLKFVNFGGNFSVHASAFEGPTGEGTPMPVKGFVKSCTSVSKVGHLVMALWDVDGVNSLGWLLENEFEGWLDLWVPSKDFILQKPIVEDPFEDPPTASSSPTAETTSYRYTHNLPSKYNRPNIRLLDQALAHMPNLPLLYPPGCIAKDDDKAYVHRVNGLTFIQTKQMIVQHEVSWTEERPVWEVDDGSEDRSNDEGSEDGHEDGNESNDEAPDRSDEHDANLHFLVALPFNSREIHKHDEPPELNRPDLSALPFATNQEEVSSEDDVSDNSLVYSNETEETEEETIYESAPEFEKSVDLNDEVSPLPAQDDPLYIFQTALPFDVLSTPESIPPSPVPHDLSFLVNSIPFPEGTLTPKEDESIQERLITQASIVEVPDSSLDPFITITPALEFFAALPFVSCDDFYDNTPLSSPEQVHKDCVSLYLLQEALPFYLDNVDLTDSPSSTPQEAATLLLFTEALPFALSDEGDDVDASWRAEFQGVTDALYQEFDDPDESDVEDAVLIAIHAALSANPIQPPPLNADHPAPQDTYHAADDQTTQQPEAGPSNLHTTPTEEVDDDDDSTYNPEEDSYEYTDSYYTDSDLDWDSDDELFVRPKPVIRPIVDVYEQFDGVARLFNIQAEAAIEEHPPEASTSAASSTPKKPESHFERRGDVPQLSEEEALAIFELWMEFC